RRRKARQDWILGVEYGTGDHLSPEVVRIDCFFEDVALDALPELAALVEARVLRRAVAPVAGVRSGVDRLSLRRAELMVFAPRQMAAVELCVCIDRLADLRFRSDARIEAPDILGPGQLETAVEVDVGGAVDREPARLVHDDAEVSVWKDVVLGVGDQGRSLL